jgi:hypothetical protein
VRHLENKNKFREGLIAVAENANPVIFENNDSKSITKIWHHLWTKNRYAGIRAQSATNEINDIKKLFDDYKWFVNPDWDVESLNGNHHQLDENRSGRLARDFVNRAGDFQNKRTIGNIPKLKKIVHIARRFTHYFVTNSKANAMDFVTNGNTLANWNDIKAHLDFIGYKADLTQLHFMMDIGLPVIKPDVVISRLFLRWKWLDFAIPDLPEDLTEEDLIGRGKYGTKYLYTKSRIYGPIIDLANNIVEGLSYKDLKDDIGWVTTNKLREFDFFIVKSGQQPEAEFGVARTLDLSLDELRILSNAQCNDLNISTPVFSLPRNLLS